MTAIAYRLARLLVLFAILGGLALAIARGAYQRGMDDALEVIPYVVRKCEPPKLHPCVPTGAAFDPDCVEVKL